jgi:hypothetical protein
MTIAFDLGYSSPAAFAMFERVVVGAPEVCRGG